MGRKGSAKRDLWASEGGSKTVNRPQPVLVAKGWHVSPSYLPNKPLAPRRRKYAPIRPNNREAVPAPLEGQSYNPTDEAHQAALAVAVRKLERKQASNEKFIKKLMLGREHERSGAAPPGQQERSLHVPEEDLYEEEVKETAQKLAPTVKSAAALAKEAKEKKKREKRERKLGKKGARQELRRSIALRRRPNEKKALEGFDRLDDVVAEMEQRQARREARRAQRREAKKENLKVKQYGRYRHTPLVEDVATSDKLVGSLRHMSGGSIHPVLERMKSLEERNLIPARMEHVYNKRKILKPKGEVRIKTEAFGIMPDN